MTKNMTKTSSSASTRSEHTTRSKLDNWTIKNTFAENCGNKYFTPAELFGACKYGLPFRDLPEEGKRMVRAFRKEYLKKCSKPGDPPKEIPDFPKDVNAIL